MSVSCCDPTWDSLINRESHIATLQVGLEHSCFTKKLHYSSKTSAHVFQNFLFRRYSSVTHIYYKLENECSQSSRLKGNLGFREFNWTSLSFSETFHLLSKKVFQFKINWWISQSYLLCWFAKCCC